MLQTLKNALKVKEIRKRLLFTLAMLVVIRIGSQIPLPGIDAKQLEDVLNRTLGAARDSGAFGFFDAITGGSFTSMSILALNINPYITSSIIMQLLTIAIPKLEEMQREGEDGRKKISLRMVSGLNSQPTGHCIQALATKIHHAEMVAPSPVSHVEAKWKPLLTLFQPKNITATKVDSIKKATMPSTANGAPKMSPTNQE